MKSITGSIAIEGKNIVKDFELGNTTTRVLKDVSIKVLKGEFVSIMGQSGSGKSTLLYILGGLDIIFLLFVIGTTEPIKVIITPIVPADRKTLKSNSGSIEILGPATKKIVCYAVLDFGASNYNFLAYTAADPDSIMVQIPFQYHPFSRFAGQNHDSFPHLQILEAQLR